MEKFNNFNNKMHSLYVFNANTVEVCVRVLVAMVFRSTCDNNFLRRSVTTIDPPHVFHSHRKMRKGEIERKTGKKLQLCVDGDGGGDNVRDYSV